MSDYLLSAALIGGVSAFFYKFSPQILEFLDKRVNGPQHVGTESTEQPSAITRQPSTRPPITRQPSTRPPTRPPIARQPINQEPLNFSITLDESLLFSVKPLPRNQQSFLYDEESKNCYTTVLIKRNSDNNYDFLFAKLKGIISEDRKRLIQKIEKIIFRIFLFNILQDEECILVTIDCQYDRNPSFTFQHQDATIELSSKIANQDLASELSQTVKKPTFVMCEYKKDCMSAQYNIEGNRLRCSMDKAQILCFNNISGTHGTPQNDLPGANMEQGNEMIARAQEEGTVRQIERYHFTAIPCSFYTKYSKSSTMTIMKHNITRVSQTASDTNNETEECDLYSFMTDTEFQQKILRGGKKIKSNKYKTKTNKHKIKANKYKIITNRYKKL